MPSPQALEQLELSFRNPPLVLYLQKVFAHQNIVAVSMGSNQTCQLVAHYHNVVTWFLPVLRFTSSSFFIWDLGNFLFLTEYTLAYSLSLSSNRYDHLLVTNRISCFSS